MNSAIYAYRNDDEIGSDHLAVHSSFANSRCWAIHVLGSLHNAGGDSDVRGDGEATMTSPDDHIYYGHKMVGRDDVRGGGIDYPAAGQTYFSNISPDRQWVEIHMMKYPIVALRVRERRDSDPPSFYWAWVRATSPDRYTLVWPSLVQFTMCFPYAYEAEEKAGAGRAVNLMVEEIQEPQK